MLLGNAKMVIWIHSFASEMATVLGGAVERLGNGYYDTTAPIAV